LARASTIGLAFGIGTGHFFLKLVGESIEFLLSQSKPFGVVAKDTFSRAFDAAFEIFDRRARALIGLSGRLKKIFAEKF